MEGEQVHGYQWLSVVNGGCQWLLGGYSMVIGSYWVDSLVIGGCRMVIVHVCNDDVISL